MRLWIAVSTTALMISMAGSSSGRAESPGRADVGVRLGIGGGWSKTDGQFVVGEASGFGSGLDKYRWLSVSLGVFGTSLVSGENNAASGWTVGPIMGIRCQSAGRLSALAGFGILFGAQKSTQNASNDRIDNDEDGQIDEAGEEIVAFSGALGAAFPEAGLRIRIRSSMTLTLIARYLLTTRGRDHDLVCYGAEFGIPIE